MRGDFMCDNERAQVKKADFIDDVVRLVLRAKNSAFKDIAVNMEVHGMSAQEALNTAIDNLSETLELRANELRGALARSLRDVKFDV